MDTIKCIRCNSKDAVFSCMQCDSFKFLCTRCDNYVHTLPSKNKHKRSSLCNIGEYEDTSVPIKTLPQMASPTNNNSLVHKSFDATEVKSVATFDDNITKGCDIGNNIGSYSMDFKINTSYSREYLNELKGIMEKEKSELLFKNATLQNNLDRLKISFTDQLSTLNTELNEIHKKHCMHLQTIQTSSEDKINFIIEEKDKQISSLQNHIVQLEQINNDLLKKQEELIKSQCELKTFYANQLRETESKLKTKEEENSSLRNNFDKDLNQSVAQHEEEKRRITFDYERRIEKLWRELEDHKRRLARINNERDDEIRHILETHNNEINKFIEGNKEIQHELECHKTNLIAIRTKRDALTQEVIELKEVIETMRRELHLRSTEVKLLDEKNKSLIKENDELRIQCSRLDKLVYGKVKTNFRR